MYCLFRNTDAPGRIIAITRTYSNLTRSGCFESYMAMQSLVLEFVQGGYAESILYFSPARVEIQVQT